MIEIVPYGLADEQAHTQFAQTFWQKKRRSIPAYIYWKFRGNSGKQLESFILAKDGDRVVGQLGMIPVQAKLDGYVYDAQWFCDLMVNPDYRGKGIANRLYDHAVKCNRVSLGSDPSPAAFKSMTKFGFRSVRGPRKYVVPVDVGRVISLKYKGFNFLNGWENPIVSMRHWFARSDIFFRSHHWEDMIDELIKARNGVRTGIVHDINFYRWRANSFDKYYAAPLLYRAESSSDFFFMYRGGDQLYCSEYRFTSWPSFINGMKLMYDHAIRKKCKTIRIIADGEQTEKFLRKIFAIPVRSITNIVCYGSEVEMDFFHYNYFDSDENI